MLYHFFEILECFCMANQTCYIFFYEGYIDIAPTINSLSRILDKQGFWINIFVTLDNDNTQEKLGEKINIIYFKRVLNTLNFLKYLTPFKTLIKFLNTAIFSLQCFNKIYQNSHLRETSKNHINVGVDFNGSLAALLCYYFFKQKYFFLSLELSEPRKHLIYRFLSKIVSLAYKKAECVIIQDQDRFEVLCEFYQYRHPKVFYLPNSPLHDSCSTDKNSRNFFRDKFNLSQEKFPYIVLQAGMLNDISCARELTQSFASIDNGCALVLHTPTIVDEFTEEMKYMKLLQQMNSKNLFLSLNPVPYEQVDNIYKSSTIGLTFYNKQENNFTKIATASGKLAFYLKHGKPVLVSNIKALSHLVNKYKCGLIIKDPSNPEEIESAIDKIIDSYDEYSKNARACFESEFSFEKKMEPILSFIVSQ